MVMALTLLHVIRMRSVAFLNDASLANCCQIFYGDAIVSGFGRGRLSPTPEINQNCDGGRVRRDAALGWHEGLRAGLVTQGSASGAEVCPWEPWNITT